MLDLGFSDAFFWSLTPRLFQRLLKHREETERAKRMLADRRAGEVAAAIYNVHRNTEKEPELFSWLDLFPEHKPPPEPMTDTEMLSVMRGLSERMAHEGLRN